MLVGCSRTMLSVNKMRFKKNEYHSSKNGRTVSQAQG